MIACLCRDGLHSLCGCKLCLSCHLLTCISAVADLSSESVSLSRLILVCIAAEHIGIGHDILIAEIEEYGWVYGYTADACLEVEVRACASPGVSTEANHIACTHCLVLVDEWFGEVGVDCLQPVIMTYDDIVSVSGSLVFHHAHLTRESRAYSVADIHFEVDAFMLAAPARPEIRGHDA